MSEYLDVNSLCDKSLESFLSWLITGGDDAARDSGSLINYHFLGLFLNQVTQVQCLRGQINLESNMKQNVMLRG